MPGGLRCDGGFTLIEMMVSMAMGLVLIAGIASVFTSMGKTSSTVSAKTERMGDLYLMSQVMQEALRFSRKTQDVDNQVLANLATRGVNIASKIPGYPAVDATFDALPYWDYATRTLTYQNIDGDVGVFCYRYSENDSIYWLRADSSIKKFDELSRNLDATEGMCALDALDTCVTVSVSNVASIKLLAAYLNEQHQDRTMSLSFMVWPRN
ncbi:MAG: prepilin-type N-terminal cleavage/methylation domain-containing protein [Mariprofundus sp.]|nr:prepilin-type N-terminal cleavage/methylation domain-containing protein [Mariprofundus sp.]